METTSDLCSIFLVRKLIILFHNLVSLAKAAVAVAIRVRIFVVYVTSLDKVSPNYLKSFTSSSLSPLKVMLTLLLLLVTMSLVFVVLSPIP